MVIPFGAGLDCRSDFEAFVFPDQDVVEEEAFACAVHASDRYDRDRSLHLKIHGFSMDRSAKHTFTGGLQVVASALVPRYIRTWMNCFLVFLNMQYVRA
jgi:hypothetical protein